MASPTPAAHRPRVVIIGSGFGGLTAAKALKRTDVDVTLVAKTTSHLFQPLLYQLATGILSAGDIAPTTRLIRCGGMPVPAQAPPAVVFELVTNGYVPKSISSIVPCAPSRRISFPSRSNRFNNLIVSAMSRSR